MEKHEQDDAPLVLPLGIIISVAMICFTQCKVQEREHKHEIIIKKMDGLSLKKPKKD